MIESLKKEFWTGLLFLLPFILLLVLQYFVDPLDIYDGPQLLPSIEVDSRNQKAIYYDQSKKDYDAIIVGSSRSMRLDPEDLKSYGYNALNFSVNSCRTEDIYCITRFVVENNKTPIRLMIIGLDVEALADNVPIDRRLYRSKVLCKYLDDQQSNANFAENLLVSTKLTFKSIYYWLSRKNKESRIQFDERTGLLHEKINPNVPKKVTFDEFLRRFDGFKSVPEWRKVYLKKSLEYCKAHNIKVEIYVSTLENDLYEFLCENTPFKDRLNDTVQLLKENDSLLNYWTDFSVVSSFNGDSTDFLDPAHLGEHDSRLIIDSLMSHLKK